jgi:DNA-directed RNA polymerase specialized sigma24 family protein
MFGQLRGTKRMTRLKTTPYATCADFRRTFERDAQHLYLLSFLLTGDRRMAEKCFVRGFGDSAKGSTVFKEWAESWARRTIILNAIRMVRPQPADGITWSSASESVARGISTEPPEISQIVELPAFERFAFVMAVLERYSDQECSLLLSCTRGEVTAARIRALQRIGSSADLRSRLFSIAGDRNTLREDLRSGLRLETLSELTVSR